MDRRTFLDMLAGSLLVAPLLARAQQTEKVRRLGILTAGTISGGWVIFFETLRELGWIEDQNLLIERRVAGGKAELVPGLAAELAQLRLDVIVAEGAVASPRAVVGQPARKRTFSGLLDALRERGYVASRNIVIEYRWAEGTAYLRSLPGGRSTLGIDMRHERRRGLFCQTQSTVRWIFV